MAIVIDTLQAMKALTEGGVFTQAQAERIVDVVAEANDDVATKGDMKELRADLEILRRDITIKMYVSTFSAAAFVIGAIRLMGI
ncbi:MAG: hypothetical protein AAF702_37715 [Chloroflexota bacterium]